MFSLASPLIAVEDITVRLGYTRSTAYRYLKELCDAGLVAPVSSGNYSLGPRIVELERLVDQLAALYARHLIPVTDLIHSMRKTRVQAFADAFKVRKK